ncbi:MAG: hypothetical protein R3F35_21085 [Myxococcota bacterium]
MPLRESVFEAPQSIVLPDAQPPSPDRPARRRPTAAHGARRRHRPIVERPTSAPPRSFSLAILPLASL